MIMNKKRMFVVMTVLLAIIFSLTYYFCDKYITKPIVEKENATVVNNDSSNDLSDETKVCLYSGDVKEDELSLGDLKKQLNIGDDLTETELSKALKDKGYVLVLTSEKELTFKRDPSQTVKPNKYYIGEKDGYLAIYKTDENGTLLIENSDDVYNDRKTIDSLTPADITKIKNFKYEYDTKEEAEENLSEFLS
ncbi:MULTISPECIES: hypothetical protein [Clostridium]|jgi:hypothetical protein|uniref:Bypass of forespore C C-terminal domain-containing protein n=3 Tax=Clostridium butyricum TaxID=1492 RepID=C4IKT1_CLOBU|nr:MULTISPECIES: hypothetical protein [Clostridium]ETI91029.1 MAG: hypothetical protein Q607_CBUC00037G0012 [Clostridium butyricum DORA_1]ALP91008.1 hypothetical protein ATN24_12960 [Clostridium butyricum]ALS17539.1 hypothetical protein ATD26_11870 [Clostridium butyricum]ANF14631.1 hypothetical protein AZ909_11410 [Clostridium butyricum]AOR94698.1 hypothetical protein BBB49_11595 [Clostridium butyricum]